MKTRRLALAVGLVLALPLTGCVFAVGSGGGDSEELRDKVRDLEKRVDQLEGGGTMQVITVSGEAK